VVSLSSGVSAVSAGNYHTCALTQAGGVKCWGNNGFGQLGDGTTTDHTTPLDVVGLSSGVSVVSAGSNHTCALTQSGGVKCWGGNSDGQLGDGTTTARRTPVNVVGLSSGVSAVSASSSHTCAVTQSGGVKCWGYGDNGQLGYKVLWLPVDVIGFQENAHPIVVFIPGIMGSKLYQDNTLIWPDLCRIIGLNGGLDPLAFNSGGWPVNTNTRTKPGTTGLIFRIFDSCGPKRYDQVVYETLVAHFLDPIPSGLGYQNEKDFWVYPYDWRSDIIDSAAGLDAIVKKAEAANGGNKKVVLVGHSMGGLVARQYISVHADKVAQVVSLGTPYLGTPKSYAVQLGTTCAMEGLDIVGLCFPSVKNYVPNFPAFNELLPSEKYFAAKGGGFYGNNVLVNVTESCSDCKSFTETYSNTALPNLNPIVFQKATEFHANLDGQTAWNGIPVTLIVGDGQKTVQGIQSIVYWQNLEKKILPIPISTSRGDGTVTTISALLEGNGGNFRGTANKVTVNTSHMDLVINPAALDALDVALGFEPLVTSQITAQAEFSGTDVQIIAVGAKKIDTYDAMENHTGPSPDLDDYELNIPNSTYFDQPSAATVSLMGGQSYTLRVTPVGDRPLDLFLLITDPEGQVTTKTYAGIAVSPYSIVTFSGDPALQFTWQLDPDGSGTEIQDVGPTLTYNPDDVIDTIPPQSTISIDGIPGPDGFYHEPVMVTLNATDDGSGVQRIEYFFSNNHSLRVYSEPFTVDPREVTSLYAFATDNAGNVQDTLTVLQIGQTRLFVPLIK
jgi:pimeloyl-ACP methyl ester carboxylesterase